MLVVVLIEFTSNCQLFMNSDLSKFNFNIYTLMKMCACVDALQVIIYHLQCICDDGAEEIQEEM